MIKLPHDVGCDICTAVEASMTETCYKCKGTGKLDIKVSSSNIERAIPKAGKNGIDVAVEVRWNPGVEKVIINCVYCTGSGKLTEKQTEDYIALDASWCRCENHPIEEIVHERRGTDIYIHTVCGKIVQVG
jgi:hypothetical protein